MEPIEINDTQNNNDNKTTEPDQQQDDGTIAIKEEKNMNIQNSIELEKTDTTIIKLDATADENHQQNLSNLKKRPKNQKNQKVLSRIPYALQNLRTKKTLMDLLRETKLRDLLSVSYIARYLFCIFIGCLSFLILALLWKFVFGINTCRISGLDRQFKYMPFAYGFMIAYRNCLLFAAPFLYLILPTVGVTHNHRSRFIEIYVLIVFIVCLCYGFYPVDNFFYILISIIVILLTFIFLFFGGYFAFWVMFPLLMAAGIAYTIMLLMRVFVWTDINDNANLFGVVYPFYLTFLQFITFKCMLWFRLPYKIRNFCGKCCPHCCCKTDNGMTPRYYSNYSDFFAPDGYDLKYMEKRSKKNMDPDIDIKQKSVDMERIEDEPIEMDIKPANNQDPKELDKEIVIKKKSSHHSYKSTEWELSIEDVWSNDILFVAGGTVIVLMESMRVAGMVALKDNYSALALNIISSILLECLARNNLIWEFIFKCFCKKENPALTRFYSTVIGTRYQTEYIPYFVITMMNVTQFGPTNSCTSEYLGDTVDIPFLRYWWFYVVLFLSEILSDLFADKVKKFGRKRGWFGDDINGDPAREAHYVKLRLWMMICCFIGFFSVSHTAFQIDFDAKTG